MHRKLSFGFLLVFAALCLHAETFQNPRHISISADPLGLIVADLNGDGLPELIFVTQATPGIAPPLLLNVLVAKADGSYSAAPPIALPANTLFRCIAADVNGDGKTDVVCPNYPAYPQFGAAAVTMFGKGDGTLGSPVLRSIAGSLAQFYFTAEGDLNGDGFADLVASGDSGSVSLLGDGTGTFRVKASVGATGMGIVADVNGDGKADLLYGTGPYVAIGNGDGTFSRSATYGQNPNCLFKDADGDGHLDAVCGNQPQGLAILHGNSDGSFGPALALSVTGPPPYVVAPLAFSDINGDGLGDVVSLSPDGLTVLPGTGPTAFGPAVAYPASVGTNPLQFSRFAVDLNGDGLPDFVEPGPKSILINYGRKDGTFGSKPSIPSGHTIAAAVVADFNGDGVPDVVTEGNTALQVPAVNGDSLLLQTGVGDGTFSAPSALPHGTASFAATGTVFLAHGDFNGDGKQDLLATSVTPLGTLTFPQTYLLLGHGDGSFEAPVVTGSSLYGGTVLDFNQDGRDDLLLARTSGGNLQVELADANGLFSGGTVNSPAPSDSSPFLAMAAGDLNNDGRPDVVLAGQYLYFLGGKGDGSFNAAGAPMDLPISLGQQVSLAVGDFDGDDTLDVAALIDNTKVYVYYGNGDGTFSASVAAATLNHGSASMQVADLDGDGRDDLVFAGGGSLPGVGVTSGVVHSRAGRTFDAETDYEAGYPLESPAIADFNRDGSPDLFFATAGHTFNLLLNNPGPVVRHTLTANPEPSAVGASVSLTTTFVPPAGGSEQQLSGQVTFFVDRVQAGVAFIVNNTATLELTAALSPGVHRLTAVWPGDAVYGSLISHATHTVNKTPVTITIGAAMNPARFGLAESLTTTIANASGSTASTPSGTYTVVDGGTSLGGGVLSGTGAATLTTTFSSGATHLLVINYSGDASHASAQATLSLPAQATPTLVTLVATPNPVGYGSGIQLTATVTPGLEAGAPAFSDNNAGFVTISGLPGGAVSLPIQFAAGASASTAAMVGQAIAATLLPGSYAVTASFSGSMDLLSSSSAGVTAVVTPPASATALSVTPGQELQGHAVTLTAAVTGALGVPTGTVQLLDGSTAIATVPLTEGTAVFSTTALAAANHALMAIYGGDANNLPSRSPVVGETVLPYDFAIAAASSPTTLQVGGAATATVTLTSVGDFAEGVTLVTGALPPGVTASIAPSTVTLVPGGHGTATITFTAARLASRGSSESPLLPGVVTALAIPALLCLRRRATLPRLLAVLACCAVMATVTACGSKNPGGAAMNQTVQITGTSTTTGQVHLASLPLTVTQ